ncbi:MAG TPA: Ig domain-containing protein [Blastocatellia bacterium]|nr:Ig domain-containing protein [Blastocatellia bacterium]
MQSPRSKFRRIKIALFTTLFLFCLANAPDRQRANAAAPPPCPVPLPNANLPDATVGWPYSEYLSFSRSKGAFTYVLLKGKLPPGLTLSSSDEISGTPLKSGSYTFTAMATIGGNCFAIRDYTINVECPTITFFPSSLPAGAVGTPYSQDIHLDGGTKPISASLISGSLPPGVTIDASGLLSGAPTTAGIFYFTLRGTDAYGCMGTHDYGLVVF